MDNRTKIRSKIAEFAGTKVSEVTDERTLLEFAKDSLGLVEMVVELQEAFGVQFTQEDFAGIVMVQDLIALIDGRLQGLSSQKPGAP